MDIIELRKGDILHEAGDVVSTIEIVSKGCIRISNAYSHLDLKSGTIAGLWETPGEPYSFYYEASEDSVIYTYLFQSPDDFAAIIRENPKIAPFMTSGCVRLAGAVRESYEKQYEDADQNYRQIRANYAEYPMLCTMLGQQVRIFPEILELAPLSKGDAIPDWRTTMLDAFLTHDAELRKGFYCLGPDICIGAMMHIRDFLIMIIAETVNITAYRRTLLSQSAAFMTAFSNLQADLQKIKNDASDSATADLPSFDNSAAQILDYSGIAPAEREQFLQLLRNCALTIGRLEISDEIRIVRREISVMFYKIYAAAFIRSLTDTSVPDVLKMFFMFGFMDESLAGHDNTVSLYQIMRSWQPDPEGTVLTIYEWLQKVYSGKAEPSRNEFNLDYPAYLREQKSLGNISSEEAAALLNNQGNWLSFEVSNLFTMGNRMTYGRSASFIPIMNSSMILTPLPNALLTPAIVHTMINKVRQTDYSCFYREVVFSNPAFGVNQLFVQKEILPHVILMPNVGGRTALWQEIEGRRRNTPARILISIFHTDDLETSFLHVCGEYRWEMCKTVQAVRWNDVTDPSLTSEYTDYLQFFKKSHYLSDEQKEKLKDAIRKNQNKFREVFIDDYIQYIRYESAGSLRLNRAARAILFTYCPFPQAAREKLRTNPQYTDLDHTHDIHQKAAMHTLAGLIRKIQNQGLQVPAEIENQYHYLQL